MASGKLVYFMLILLMIDIGLIVTGQLDITSSTALMVNMITDPSSITASQFWIAIQTNGMAKLAAAGGVVVIGVLTGTNVLVFLSMAIIMSNFVGDFALIFNKLAAINIVLATFMMVPIMMAFVLITIEWLRGKD